MKANMNSSNYKTNVASALTTNIVGQNPVVEIDDKKLGAFKTSAPVV